jgi:hypothetical protein
MFAADKNCCGVAYFLPRLGFLQALINREYTEAATGGFVRDLTFAHLIFAAV